MTGEVPYLDPSLPVPESAKDLVSRMTLEEKTRQMLHHAPAIERLGVPQYNWWNECLHGVGRAGYATVFPQAIGLAATWSTALLGEVATAISDEARAKHHDFARQGKRGIYEGLTFWTPNINIFRDPRWGRGQETYGEDPHLTSRLGVEFVKGLQGSHPRYLKVAACAKHFAVHSGPEAERHGFDAKVSQTDLWDTYLPAFKALVEEAKVESVMGAYNRTNGEACCASETLLGSILRGEWAFSGHVVSDCGAICDIWKHHRVASDPDEAAALAVNRGCDLCCGDTYQFLTSAVEKGYITEAAITRAVERLFSTRIKLGMFDDEALVPYAQLPIEVNDSAAHRTLALRAARESVVLLKNDGVLPLPKSLCSVAVVGPNADSLDVLLGNYNGTASSYVTPLEGLRRKLPYATVLHARGCELAGGDDSGFAEALSLAGEADVVVACMGLSPRIEGEEGDSQGDRVGIGLPGLQDAFLAALHRTGKPIILVLLAGSAVAIDWAEGSLPAILQAWYPGEEGGLAIADILFGDYCPAGRLPVTVYRSEDDLPDFTDYSMEGRTYRYFRGEALYPFGWGLSYSRFGYAALSLSACEVAAGAALGVSVDVMNTGDRAGDEVVQVYISRNDSTASGAIRNLRGFVRVALQPGQTKRVSITIDAAGMSTVDDQGRRQVEPGHFTVSVGGCQPVQRWLESGNQCLSAAFEVTGPAAELPR